MTTRMVHPQHGATHAYDKGEVERLEKLGWLVEASSAFILKAVPVQPEPQPIAPAIGVPERKKPGPKPKAK